jgi:hypothetical protein
VIRNLCSRTKKKVVLLVDEIDAIPERIVIGFLHSLREMYLERTYKPTFHSIALVGVRDIKSLKVKIRNESKSIGSQSPFNIAVDYKIPLFTLENIKQYYQQHTKETGQIFEDGICEKVHQVTNGYPFLVSYIAKAMVEVVVKDRKKNITINDCESAIQILLKDRPANFESLYKNASEPKIRTLILDLLRGEHREFNIHDDIIDHGYRFGIFDDINGRLSIANQIYAQVLYQHFKVELVGLGWDKIAVRSNLIDTTGKLNFKLVLDKF